MHRIIMKTSCRPCCACLESCCLLVARVLGLVLKETYKAQQTSLGGMLSVKVLMTTKISNAIFTSFWLPNAKHRFKYYIEISCYDNNSHLLRSYYVPVNVLIIVCVYININTYIKLNPHNQLDSNTSSFYR